MKSHQAGWCKYVVNILIDMHCHLTFIMNSYEQTQRPRVVWSELLTCQSYGWCVYDGHQLSDVL